MKFEALSDKEIAKTLGQRLKNLRLRKNIPQRSLADATLLSVNAIKSLEAGKGKLATLIPVLRELGVLGDLDNFIPEPPVSPMQLAKMRGKIRERASQSRGSPNNPSQKSP